MPPSGGTRARLVGTVLCYMGLKTIFALIYTICTIQKKFAGCFISFLFSLQKEIRKLQLNHLTRKSKIKHVSRFSILYNHAIRLSFID